MRAAALLLLLPSLVLADIGWRQGGVAGSNRVIDVQCQSDGGLYCVRDAGTQIGLISCTGATATEPGCITPSAQTLAGTKTLTGDLRLVGHVHASLTACASGTKGTWQTCTGHNAPVFCDGTNNIEFLGGASAETPLESLHVDGIPATVFGAFTLSGTSSWTITAVTGFWGVGTGVGSLPLTLVSTAGTCTCTIDCDNPGARTACSGNCTIPVSTTVFGFRGTSTCTLDPYVGGNLTVMGTRP